MNLNYFFRNLRKNRFKHFPWNGLKEIRHINIQDNAASVDFMSSSDLPNVKSLKLTYPYHCCDFMDLNVHLVSMRNHSIANSSYNSTIGKQFSLSI